MWAAVWAMLQWLCAIVGLARAGCSVQAEVAEWKTRRT